MIQTNTNVNRFGNHGARFAAYGGVLKVWHWNFGCTFFSLFNPRSAERLLASFLSRSQTHSFPLPSKCEMKEQTRTCTHTLIHLYNAQWLCHSPFHPVSHQIQNVMKFASHFEMLRQQLQQQTTENAKKQQRVEFLFCSSNNSDFVFIFLMRKKNIPIKIHAII